MTIRGIDVSHFNGCIDWRSVAAAGYRFAYVKTTEGAGFIDPAFLANARGASEVGLLVGGYHYVHPSVAYSLQASNFIESLNKFEFDLPPALDVEATPDEAGDGRDLWMKLTPLARVALLSGVSNSIQEATRRAPIIYCSPGWWGDAFGAADFSGHPLWTAEYGVARPHVPLPWKRYAIWQYSSKVSIPGTTGQFDADALSGELSLEQLKEI